MHQVLLVAVGASFDHHPEERRLMRDLPADLLYDFQPCLGPDQTQLHHGHLDQLLQPPGIGILLWQLLPNSVPRHDAFWPRGIVAVRTSKARCLELCGPFDSQPKLPRNIYISSFLSLP